MPSRISANCLIGNFAVNSEQILLDLVANQLKWQHCVCNSLDW